MTTEHELAQLLRSNERPRDLTEQELGRLRTRLGLADPQLSDPTTTVEGPLSGSETALRPPLGDPSEQHPPNPKRRRILLSTAAAAAVTILVLTVQRPQPPTRVETNNSQAADTQLGSFCSNELDELSSALESWNGFGPWALSTKTPEPDLGAIILTAFDELNRQGLIDDEGREMQRLVRASLQPAPGGPIGADAVQDPATREQSARDGAQYLHQRITLLDTNDSCDLDRLGKAIDLGT